MKSQFIATYECYSCKQTTLSVVSPGVDITLCGSCEDAPTEGIPLGRLTGHCLDCGAEHYIGSEDRDDDEYLGGIRCSQCAVVLRDRDDE